MSLSTSITPSEWGKGLKPSPTLTLHKMVHELKAKGIKVHDFGIGEMYPDITVPTVMKEGMKEAIDNDQTYYTAAVGDDELLQALSEDSSKNFGLNYNTKQIAVFSGPKDALFKACLCVLSPAERRNRTVVFTPAFEAFENIPYLITGKYPIRLKTDAKFYPVVEDLQKLLETDDTIALIIINSPNNPSGAVYPSDLIERLSTVIKQFPHIAVICDEVYRTVCYDGVEYTNIAKFIPHQTLVVGGASKEVAGTGLRIGYIAGPEELIAVIGKIQGNTSACVTLPCQRGYAKFLREDSDMKIRLGMRDRLQEKRDKIFSAMKSHPSLSCLKLHAPEGAFYAFPNIEALYGKTRPDGGVIGQDDEDVMKFLIEVGHVATVPGSKMGTPGHIRIAYASKSLTEIEEGMQALADAVAKLK